jgi:hypothetical protein
MTIITGPYPGSFNTPASEMLVSHTTFPGSVTNTGVIGAGRIVVIHGTFQSGGLTNTGTVIGGIHIDSSSKLLASGGTAVAVEKTATFAGGISNAGALSGRRGILVGATTSANPHVGVFSGGVVNRGAISTSKTDIAVRFVSVFAGGITNRGAVTAMSAAAILVSNIASAPAATFAGNIVNSGAISAAQFGLGIQGVAFAGGSFDGSIINTASISAGHTGINIAQVGGAVFSGNISNSGAIKTVSVGGGIAVASVVNAGGGTFAGNIVNGGAISATSGFGLRVTNVANNGGTFDGNIVNSGAISAAQVGLRIANVAGNNGRFNGRIVNTAKISGGPGINIQNVGGALFSGGISNTAPSLQRSTVALLLAMSPPRPGRPLPATSSTAGRSVRAFLASGS